MADDKLRATPAARKLADDLGSTFTTFLAQVQTVGPQRRRGNL